MNEHGRYRLVFYERVTMSRCACLGSGPVVARVGDYGCFWVGARGFNL
jgi:hypothetical protein